MKLDKLETQAVDFVARFSPWLAPLPTAYLTATATVEHLAWPQAVGIIAGVIVEALGLSSVSTALKLREYNATRRKIPDDWEPTDKNGRRKTYRGIVDPPAPFKLTIITAVVYFGAVTFLTVALDTAPNLATYAPLVFPVMSLAGAIVLAVRADHKRRLDAIVEADSKRKDKRQASKTSESKPAKSKVARYACEICGAIAGKSGLPFANQHALNAHQRAHASLEPADNGSEPATVAEEAVT